MSHGSNSSGVAVNVATSNAGEQYAVGNGVLTAVNGTQSPAVFDVLAANVYRSTCGIGRHVTLGNFPSIQRAYVVVSIARYYFRGRVRTTISACATLQQLPACWWSVRLAQSNCKVEWRHSIRTSHCWLDLFDTCSS